MHVSTHHDRIWQAGCQQKEDSILQQLQMCRPDAHIQLVDCLQTDTDKTIITDNYFLDGRTAEYVFPEFWHIYLCEPLKNVAPNHRLNCLMNRLSGERMMLLFKLHERNLISDNIVSFNCLYHTRDPDITQRKQFFKQVYHETGWTQYNKTFNELKERVPFIIDHDPDSAALASEVTLVVESYVSDSTVAFSEKIFRALQTPRPWLLFCSPGSVKLLRDLGFDVLDDLIDHDYDAIVDQESRLDTLLDSLDKTAYNQHRCEMAVEHNQARLQELSTLWTHKHEKICDVQ